MGRKSNVSCQFNTCVSISRKNRGHFVRNAWLHIDPIFMIWRLLVVSLWHRSIRSKTPWFLFSSSWSTSLDTEKNNSLLFLFSVSFNCINYEGVSPKWHLEQFCFSIILVDNFSCINSIFQILIKKSLFAKKFIEYVLEHKFKCFYLCTSF